VLNVIAIVDSVFKTLESIDSTKDQIIELQAHANYQYDFAPFTKVFLDSAITLALEYDLEEDEAKVLLDFMSHRSTAGRPYRQQPFVRTRSRQLLKQ
jgi:hypothetical protein